MRQIYIDADGSATNEYGDQTELLGYAGETNATELNISLPSDWTGSFYLDWHYSGDWHEGTTEYTDTDITAIVPSLPVGDVYLRIRAEDNNVLYVDPIKFRVKP